MFKYLPTLLGLGAAVHVNAAVFDSLNEVPREWSFIRAAHPADRIKLWVAVEQRNIQRLEQMVLDMSTPGHASYGNHMSGQQVMDMIRPAAETTTPVLRWLESFNVTDIQDDGNWIAFNTDVATADEMLDANFSYFQHKTLDRMTLRTLSYSLPDEIAANVKFVQPTTKFNNVERLSSTIHETSGANKANAMSVQAAYVKSLAPGLTNSTVAPPDAVCDAAITPQCLLKLYNVHYGANPNNGAKVAFASFLEQYARYTDLSVFETTQALYASGHSFNVTSFNGGLNAQNSTADATEANLDCQYLASVGYPVALTEYSTAGRGPQINDVNEPTFGDNEPYMEFLAGILALKDRDLPQTLSISYGEDEQTWPKEMAKSVCNSFMQLGARGVSIMISSGDSGPGAICTSNDGSNSTKFIPNFPVSCPFVTGVGATSGVPEKAVSFSGGGFSNYFSRPAYQSKQVEIYLKNNPAFQQYYNTTGRGIPDISAQGLDYLVVNMGVTEPVSGTSASSPTFASIIALLNSARIEAGMKPLGFLNPFLYSKGYAGLNDIKTGGSTGCSNIPGAGFNATCGWDPVTGLGTPDFGKLLALTVPQQCNIGGELPNPTASACSPAKNSVSSSSLLAARTLCPVM